MISRRDLLVGGMLLGASAGAWAWTPRSKMSLLGSTQLEKLIPESFGQWRALPASALVVPEEEGSLASQLYSQRVGRIYANPDNEAAMLLVAYGDTQSDALQLHRPEVCYPAFGFDIRDITDVPVPLAPGLAIPGRRLVASSNMRTEQILYWTRIGEYLPASGSDQRWARLRSEMAGTIPDGVLVRISSLGADPARGFDLNRTLARDLMAAVSPAARRVLVGTAPARALTS
jgi:EpsI family protein